MHGTIVYLIIFFNAIKCNALSTPHKRNTSTLPNAILPGNSNAKRFQDASRPKISPVKASALGECTHCQRRKFIESTIASGLVFTTQLLRQKIALAQETPPFFSTVSTAIASEPINNSPEIININLSSAKEISQFIEKYANRNFVSNVKKSGLNFLYRGLSSEQSEVVLHTQKSKLIGPPDLSPIIIRKEPFDLIDPETYQSNEAAVYFQQLEEEMTSKDYPIRPSNGHLGTTCPTAAAQWGRAASIWPLGEGGVEFAWMEEGGLFWPRPSTPSTPSTENGDGPTGAPVVSCSLETNIGGSYRGGSYRGGIYRGGCGGGSLANALQGDAWEIMFRADNGFLAVPVEFDVNLKRVLKGQ